MDDDQEIPDLLAREIRDPNLRRRIFSLLQRDPATLTPDEQQLVEHTVGGILAAETERLRAEAERLQGPWWWLPRLLRKPPRPPGPSAAAPSRGSRQLRTAASAADRDDEISVRGYLRQLRWIAPGLLVAFLELWALGMARQGVPLAAVLFLWAFVTVAVGPLFWVWGIRRDAPGRWRALGLALLWFVGVLAVFGIGVLVVAVLSGG